MIKKEDSRTAYIDDSKWMEELKDHVEKSDDISSLNHLLKQATRVFLGSRRNKGNFKRH